MKRPVFTTICLSILLTFIAIPLHAQGDHRQEFSVFLDLEPCRINTFNRFAPEELEDTIPVLTCGRMFKFFEGDAQVFVGAGVVDLDGTQAAAEVTATATPWRDRTHGDNEPPKWAIEVLLQSYFASDQLRFTDAEARLGDVFYLNAGFGYRRQIRRTLWFWSLGAAYEGLDTAQAGDSREGANEDFLGAYGAVTRVLKTGWIVSFGWRQEVADWSTSSRGRGFVSIKLPLGGSNQ